MELHSRLLLALDRSTLGRRPQQPDNGRVAQFCLASLAQRFEVADIVARNAEFSNCWQTLFEDLVWSMFRTGTILRALASLH
jgi:hypothetical protein